MSHLRKDDKNIRLSQDLSDGEKQAVGNRKVKILQCLKYLGIACDKNNIPTIAVLGSGGGLRAMLALQGTLVEMKKQGLLDAVMYLCGVSGSTWCMSLLYKDKDWAEKVQDLEEGLCNMLSISSWSHQEAYSTMRKAAEDELFSLTDIWASLFVHQMLQQYDQTKLSKHEGTSTSGKNPYPIYAAVEHSKLHTQGENSPGTWFEFTPHESGFPGLGAFVCTKDLGSKFEHGKLTNSREEKNVCYLQALWGSALGSMEKNKKFVRELVYNTFIRRLREESSSAFGAVQLPEMDMPIHGRSSGCICVYCRGTILLVELQFQTSAGKDSEGIFRDLKEVLKAGEKSKNSFQKCCEMSETWGSKTLEERMEDCAELGRIFETELGGEKPETSDSSYGGRTAFETSATAHSRRKPDPVTGAVSNETGPVSGPVSSALGDILRGHNLIQKISNSVLHWTWGSTNNFLYKCRDVESIGLTNDKVIYLIDAGLAINSAYPLVLRPERKVKLILSFDFSSGDPFETIKKTAEYCGANQIPFPKIDPKKLENPNNPADCFIFKGKDVPTVMHFPLFNSVNCPGEIDDFRNRFSTFSLSYPKDDVKKLLEKAKMNVSNNKERILKEIQHIVSSSTENY